MPAGGITTFNARAGAVVPLTGDYSAFYQPLDGDLTSLAAASGTNTIYYRSAASTWSPVTIGSNLTFSGGTLAATAGGGGNVSSVGTPTNGQIAQWTSATTIQGLSNTGTGNNVLATSPTIVTPTIAALANLTTNGFVKTSGGSGTLSVDTTAYQPAGSYLTANQPITLTGAVTGGPAATSIATTYATAVPTTLAGLPTGGAANQILSKIDGTNYNTQWVSKSLFNGAKGGSGIQQPPAGTDTYISDSGLTINAGDLSQGTCYHCYIQISKTAAGNAAGQLVFRVGTAGTTADAAIYTAALPAGTAVVDTGVMDFYATFFQVGASAQTVSIINLTHNLTNTGLWNLASGQVAIGSVATSAVFNSTTATKLGISYNGGAAAVHTLAVMKVELTRP